MQTSGLRLRTHRPVDEQRLLAIEGVVAVEPLEEGLWHIQHQPENNPASRVAQTVVEHAWGLLELTPERRSLEQIFVDITTAEPAADLSTEESEVAA
jgi:ABC-2 type transport system ATP-binding protein